MQNDLNTQLSGTFNNAASYQDSAAELYDMKQYMFGLHNRIFSLEEQLANMCQYLYRLESMIDWNQKGTQNGTQNGTENAKRRMVGDESQINKARRLTPEESAARMKTKLCVNFQQKGLCRFGDSCSFAHGQIELRTSL